MILSIRSQTPPPRNGGNVTVIAEGRVNPGQVSGDGKAVVFGEFKPGQGESVHRWKNQESVQLNQDGFSSYQARCNDDASVVTFHRYSLKDASDKTGNWDIGRWEDGQVEVIAGSDADEMSPSIDDSGKIIVYDRTEPTAGNASIQRWDNGQTEAVSNGNFLDLFPEVSGDGERVIWRRDLKDIHFQDQDGINKPLAYVGEGPASVMLDRSGDKVLYATRDEDGDQDIFLTDLSEATTTAVSAIKGMDEYQGHLSGDGNTVVFTGIDRRKAQSDMNVYVWNNGETEQLTWNDGGMNFSPTVSDDGKAVSWLWMDLQDTTDRKIMLWQKDEK